jgi:hypothetical protein
MTSAKCTLVNLKASIISSAADHMMRVRKQITDINLELL